MSELHDYFCPEGCDLSDGKRCAHGWWVRRDVISGENLAALKIEARSEQFETLRIEVARWANERRGTRQSDLLAIYERRIFGALDALGAWRERP